MIYESFCDSWGVCYAELIRRHTLGQLILLATGSQIRADEMEREFDKGAGHTSASPLGKSARTGRTITDRRHEVFRPNKPFKSMTGQEYMAYCERAGKTEDA